MAVGIVVGVAGNIAIVIVALVAGFAVAGLSLSCRANLDAASTQTAGVAKAHNWAGGSGA
jgi:hypothetical protein